MKMGICGCFKIILFFSTELCYNDIGSKNETIRRYPYAL